MKFIPRKARVKSEIYKNFTFADLFVAVLGIAVALLIFFSNLPYHIYIGLAFISLWIMLFIPIADGVKLYASILLIFKFIAYKKNYYRDYKNKNEDIRRVVPFTGVSTGKFIDFGGQYYAMVLEIDPIDFFLLEEEKQERVISTFGQAFQRLNLDQKMTILKTKKPMIFDSKITIEDNRYNELVQMAEKGLYSVDELDARAPVFQERLEAIRFLNDEEKVMKTYYYMVVYDTYKDSLESTITGIAASLSASVTPITSKVLENDELYAFLKSTFQENFDERELDYLAPDQKVKWAMPEHIKFKVFSTEIDNVPYRTFTVTDYPIEVPNAWAYPLFELDNCRVAFNIEPMDKVKSEKLLDKSLMEMEIKISKGGKQSRQIENQTQYDTLKELLTNLKNNNENLFNTNIHICAQEGMKKEVRAVLKQNGFKFTENFGRQVDAFVSANISRLDQMRVYERSIHTSSLAAMFPMVSSNLQDERGFYVGVSLSSGYPAFINFFERNNERVNSNMVVLGKSGGGKSFATKTILTNLAADNTRIFILDPEREYYPLCKNLGGKFIDVGSSVNGIFNPFHIFTTLQADEGEEDDSYNAHLQFLEQFFRIILSGMAPDPFEELNALIVDLYQSKGIDNTTDLTTLKPTDYPIFDDLLALINDRLDNETDEFHKKNLQTMKIYISKFATGGRNSNLWNGPTSIETNENFVCFNFRSLLNSGNELIAGAQMLLIFKYLMNEITKNKDFNDTYYERKNKMKKMKEDEYRRIIITVDEAHVFINKKYPVALEFMAQMAKRIRKYRGMQIVCTQNIKDFVGSEEIAQQSTAVINASQYSMIFSLAPADITDLIALYRNAGGINKDEQDNIVSAGRGDCFFISSAIGRTFIHIDALKNVKYMFEHDPDNDEKPAEKVATTDLTGEQSAEAFIKSLDRTLGL